MHEEEMKGKTMTIQEAMQKANEGGYHINGSDGMATDCGGANSDFSLYLLSLSA
jgi:hypothetical protein